MFTATQTSFKSINAYLSAAWLETLYIQWKTDPLSVDREWHIYFTAFNLALNINNTNNKQITNSELVDESVIQILLYIYRYAGHFQACIDPLSNCTLDTFHESIVFLSQLAFLDHAGIISLIKHNKSVADRGLIENLQQTYCHNVGVEFMHIQSVDEREWIKDFLEIREKSSEMTSDNKLNLLRLLHSTSIFESFLQTHFPAQKRFSLEGSEVLVPALDAILRSCPSFNISDVILGMPHRGRLNVLAHIFDKPIEDIVAEFRDNAISGFVGDGDVKYHKGYSTDIWVGDSKVHITLASNPSHLEAVNSVVLGKSRARQHRYSPSGSSQVLPILIHGDSSFAGQGSIMEILNLSQLDGYNSGGTIHIIVNNQIGFTTSPHDSRSTNYSTDVAKMLACPIFHVQGEAPESVLHVVQLAVEYRQKFKKDVVIELVCYRRHGHNESDEPAFTQPLMYQRIEDRPPLNQIYANTLLEDGFPVSELELIENDVKSTIADCFMKQPNGKEIGFHDLWDSVARDFSFDSVKTHISYEKLVLLSRRLAELPPGFCPHPKIHSLMLKRFEAVLKDAGIDWGNAEILAYASLLDEGYPVRLSGQDSRRGTFSHRHSVLHDMNDDRTYTPLNTVATENASFQVWDSPLSEFGVLGFEYGYSLETPHGLTIWEAQFGDFANGAQVIIDQFISSGETKWNRASGLVMYLPHGFEGQGAEHSSARIERYLQLCAGNNMILVNLTSPAQLFHLLRRQLKQSFRKPLIVFTPKSLLRHPQCVSSCDDICNGTFNEILMDSLPQGSVKRILLCSGKIYYELLEERERVNAFDTAIIRIEQIYPLRTDLLLAELSRFGSEACFAWVQEEPENMGVWSYVRYILTDLGFNFRYVGRPSDSCPAVGSHRLHMEQQTSIIQSAFQVV